MWQAVWQRQGETRPRPRQRFARGEMNLALAARLKQWHVAREGLPRVARCTLLTLQQQLWARLQTTLAANFLLTLQQLRHQASGMRREASSLSRSHRKNTRNAVRIRIRIRTPHSAFAFANKHIKFAANLALSSKGGREGGAAGQVKVCRNKSIKCSQCKVRRESARAVAENYLSGKNLCIMKTVNSKL